MSDSAASQKALQGYLGDVKDVATGNQLVSPFQAANRIVRKRVFRYTKAQDAATGTPVAEVPIMNPLVAINITAITFTPDSTLATGATNFMTVTMQRRTAGGASTGAVSVTTNTGGTAFTQWIPVSIPLLNTVNGSFPLAANDILTYTNAKTGTGSQLPGGVFEIEYEEAY